MLWPNETGWFQPACRHDRPSTTTDCTLGGGTLCGGCFFRKSLDHADFTSLYWFSSGGKLLKIFLDEEGKQVKFWLLCVLVVWITQLLNKKFQFTIAMLMFLYLLNKINIVFLFLLTDSFIINDLGGILWCKLIFSSYWIMVAGKIRFFLPELTEPCLSSLKRQLFCSFWV